MSPKNQTVVKNGQKIKKSQKSFKKISNFFTLFYFFSPKKKNAILLVFQF